MSWVRRFAFWFAQGASGWVLLSCAPASSAKAPDHSASEAVSRPVPSATAGSELPSRTIASVDASVIFTDCPKAPIARSNDVQATLNNLVKDCDTVPAGQVRIVATLVPGGRIELSAPKGEPEGVVPLCVLKHELRHRLLVVKRCHMEIQMSERKGR